MYVGNPNANQPTTNNWQGDGWGPGAGYSIGSLLEPHLWYYILIAVDNDGEFLTAIWEKGQSAPTASFKRSQGSEWTGKVWEFAFTTYGKPKVIISEYCQVTFDGLR